MRIMSPYKLSFAKISLLFLVVIISSCNALKRVDENELLIVKNNILVDSTKITDEDIESLIIQKPNSSLLGFKLRLNLYNLAKVNPDSSFQAWLHRKPKRKQRLTNLLSKKQVHRLGQSFLAVGLSESLKNIGEPPAILDTAKTRKSLKRINTYYSTKGYFNNKTTYVIDSLKRKQRIAVNYKITLGDPYVIDSISQNIASQAIDSLYDLAKTNSLIKTNQQFNLLDFNNERDRLTEVFRNKGVYNFQKSAINYDLVSDTTLAGNDRKINVKLNIDDLKKREGNTLTTTKYKVFKFNDINIYTEYPDGDMNVTRFNDYTIYHKGKLRYKPETLADAIFFHKDSIYKDIDRLNTQRQINNLNLFRYPSINFEEDSTNTKLAANIYLSARPKYSFNTNFDVTHSNIQTIGLGFAPSLKARNLFKGAENLSLSGRLNIGSSSEKNLTDRLLLEFGADLKLDFPRILLPLVNTKKIIPNYMLPKTRFSVGGNSQKNIGLDKQTFNAVLGYSWSPSDFKKHKVELLNVQFVRNINTNRFFDVYRNTYNRLNNIAQDEAFKTNPFLTNNYDQTGALTIPEGANDFINAVITNDVPSTSQQFQEVLSVFERTIRLTNDDLIFASNYTFDKNNRKGPTDNNFYQFSFKVEAAGNLLSALSNFVNFNKNENNQTLILNVPYSQYIKTEYDFVKYWNVSRSNVLAFHSFFGIAIPYGNAKDIPFVRSYFGGGSNDNRAWRPYSLGPGTTGNFFDFNEANLKLALNLEYRFPVLGNLKGAIFADAGNIWNVFDNASADATFNGISSLKDIALGSGFGLRYDFTYFVIRLDLGFKTYNPAEEISKRWFRDYNFGNSVLQIGINYPF